ncbi:hypothetical protein [Streptomyces iconiensis]|uniref:Uncharacterized protein n=1 Tax=Streptomyces iconiensis TaxID=1384038 RepID=A0ABT6ZX48_9ACTN|nr:hypothetical protein [Streptomyces iconiensis]MDJ1132973.1 hypothetical protein [Streptomyces iconiensis]
MVRKKVEGNEEERRAAAREAERVGERPSERGETTGASKQRRHMTSRNTLTHEDKLASQHRGKQEWRAGDLAEEELVDTAATEPARTFQGRGSPPYGDQHEQVFRALASTEADNGGNPVALQDVAQAAGLTDEDTRVLLHDLVSVHNLATEIQTNAEGALYTTSARR